MHVHTSETYLPHSVREPSLTTFQPFGTSQYFVHSEYCSYEVYPVNLATPRTNAKTRFPTMTNTYASESLHTM